MVLTFSPNRNEQRNPLHLSCDPNGASLHYTWKWLKRKIERIRGFDDKSELLNQPTQVPILLSFKSELLLLFTVAEHRADSTKIR